MKSISVDPTNRQVGYGIYWPSRLMLFRRAEQLTGSPTISVTEGWLNNCSGLITVK
jgi:hypothetical protein